MALLLYIERQEWWFNSVNESLQGDIRPGHLSHLCVLSPTRLFHPEAQTVKTGTELYIAA